MADITLTSFCTTVSYVGGYPIVGSGGGTAPTGYQVSADGSIFRWSVGNVAAAAHRPAVTGAGTQPFNYPVIGFDKAIGGRYWTYVPPGCSLYWVITHSLANAAGDITGTLTYQVWTAAGETFDTVAALSILNGFRTGATTAISASSIGGYWVSPVNWVATQPTIVADLTDAFHFCAIVTSGLTSFTNSTTSTSGGTATVSGASVTALYPIVSATEFANSTLPWMSTRVTATAFLGTNVTQVLNKGGTVMCGRLPPQVTSPWAATLSQVNALHPAEKAFLPLETGVYTFLPPSHDMLEFNDYTVQTVSAIPVANALAIAPLYALDNTSLCHVIYITAGPSTESLAVTADWHLEFRTSSALFNIGVCATPMEVLHQAQMAMAEAGFFFDNIDHKAILSKVMTAMKRFAPFVMNTIHPGLYGAAKTAYRIVTRPNTTVPTTTARASGITGPPRARGRPQTRRKRGKGGSRQPPKPTIAAPPKRKSGLQMYLESRRRN